MEKLLPQYPEVGEDFAQLMQQVLMAVSEVCNLLERYGGTTVTDWRTLSEEILEWIHAEGPQAKVGILPYVTELVKFEEAVLIGRGTFSRVYRVRFRPTDCFCAIKIVPIRKFSAAQIRLKYVDKALSALAQDPGIIKVHSVFRVKPKSFLMVMDVGRKERFDMERVLGELKYLKDESASLITLQIILALETLHLSGFIHRDLSCSNILIDATGHIKLIDFDSAKICSGHFVGPALQSYFMRTAVEFTDDEAFGEKGYRAPELRKGSGYGRALDWWSLGIVLHKLSTGRIPYRSHVDSVNFRRIYTLQFFWRDRKFSASETTQQFTEQLLRKKPSERLGSKGYAEIRQHPFFQRAVSMLQVTPVMRKKKVVELREPRVLVSVSSSYDDDEVI